MKVIASISCSYDLHKRFGEKISRIYKFDLQLFDFTSDVSKISLTNYVTRSLFYATSCFMQHLIVNANHMLTDIYNKIFLADVVDRERDASDAEESFLSCLNPSSSLSRYES